jgi:hypothetical protein
MTVYSSQVGQKTENAFSFDIWKLARQEWSRRAHPRTREQGSFNKILTKKHLNYLVYKTPNFFEKKTLHGSMKNWVFLFRRKRREIQVLEYKHYLILIKCMWASKKSSECRDVLELLAEYGDPLSPIASAFQDLWIRAISVMPEGWSLRFAKGLQWDVFANFLESLNLHHNICPSLFAIHPRKESQWNRDTSSCM